AVIFVVDSSDVIRLKEAAEELQGVLEADELSGTTLLVYNNKADLPGAVTSCDLVSRLQLNRLNGQRAWMVQQSCAVTGEGLLEGLDWLSRELEQHQGSTNK
ncbi:unnamed protein product, partial [Cyprideis torosa]